MISVEITKNRNNYEKIICNGHAEYAEYGEDIVCSAVSMLVINTINSIDKLAECGIKVKENADKGYLEMTFKGNNSDDSMKKASLFFESLILGLNGVIDNYGEEFVTLKIKEV